MIHKDIDIVIVWVDGSDPKWLEAKNRHLGKDITDEEISASASRFRDWGNLQYIFRGIETYMPWVRKVHFVTSGHKPEWLNLNSERLNWVRHEDYIPKEYLPTFSSHVIEMNMHRIKGLSEQFIYFNDDTFVLKKMREDFFFKNGLPQDQCIFLRVPTGPRYGEVVAAINDTFVINQNFNRQEAIKKHWKKMFSIRNGLLSPLLSATYLPFNYFPGFLTWHVPQPFLKSTFIDIWDKEPKILHDTSMRKFRSTLDVNQYLAKYWQFVTGSFQPKNIGKHVKNIILSDQDSINFAQTAIRHQKYQLICLNDTEMVDFEYAKDVVNSEFETLFPVKSEFEL